MIDADGSTDPGEIPSFIAPLIKGADLVKGSRYLKGEAAPTSPVCEASATALLGASVNLMFGTELHRPLLRLQRLLAPVLPQLHVTCDGFEVETLLNVRAAKAGFDVVEVPSFEHDRIHGLEQPECLA